MRSLVLLCGMLSLIFGQVPSLAWVELADTIYGIDGSTQNTFRMLIYSRSGNMRRLDWYDTTRGRLFLATSDSVYLDGSGRVQRILKGGLAEARFSYLGSPTLKVEFISGPSNTVYADLICDGLTIFKGSQAWFYPVSEPQYLIMREAYPVEYHIGQWGDTILLRNFAFGGGAAAGTVRWTRLSACDTFVYYQGSANSPRPTPGGKICHTNGRIDSVISPVSRTYWSYDANNRPIRRVQDVSDVRSDTTRYIYDDSGRLIETRKSGVDIDGPFQRRYLLRYRGAPTSLSSVLGGDCLFWDASQRRGALTCQPAGAFTALRLYDLQGRIVWQGSVQGAETFEVPLTLPPGLYYLHTDVGTARLYLMP
jgi:YD repeat-containing protein